MIFRRAILPDSAGIFGFIVFLILARFSGRKALQDGDTLWHIRIGQDILQSGQIPNHDVFSHTAYGHPWTAHEWLAEVLMAISNQLGGLPLVTLFYFCCVALCFTMIYQAARYLSNDWIALIFTSIGLVLAMTHLLARPHLFSWLLSSLTLLILVRKGKTLWLLPIIIILWANLHGGVLLGIVLQGAFLAGALLQKWPASMAQFSREFWPHYKTQAYVFVLSFLALGMNPFGYELILFQFQVSQQVYVKAIGEWKSPNLQSMWYIRFWLLTIILFSAWFGRKIEWKWCLLILFFVYESLIHVRHVSISAILLTPWFAQSTYFAWQRFIKKATSESSHYSWLKQTSHFIRLRFSREPLYTDRQELCLSPWSGPILIIVAFIVFAGLASSAPNWWQKTMNEHYPFPKDYSEEAIDFLRQTIPGDKLLNDYSWGDYLIYALQNPPPVFIDGRADIYSEKIFNQYLSAEQLRPDIENVLEEHAIDWIIFPSDHLLCRYLLADAAWEQVYRDEKVQILSKHSGD